jgi:hypothetical protein
MDTDIAFSSLLPDRRGAERRIQTVRPIDLRIKIA